MRLGRLANAVAAIAATLVLGAGAAFLSMAVTDATMATLASATPWAVTVGPASRTMYPGLDVTMPFDIENSGPRTQVLHGTAVEFRNDGVNLYDTNTGRYLDGCLASWFRAGASSGPANVDVAPGDKVHGTVAIAFDDRPGSQDACRNLGLEVIVTAD